MAEYKEVDILKLAIEAEPFFTDSTKTAFRNIVNKVPTVDAVEVGNCEGCIYSHRKRPQKCSCCRRNRDLKDCYEEE